ncbi:MAG: hypothetical protein FWC58_10130, partial [Desulfobulbus sp.]|nr:hypothetical protein [Desulfobulbus sp.]
WRWVSLRSTHLTLAKSMCTYTANTVLLLSKVLAAQGEMICFQRYILFGMLQSLIFFPAKIEL